MAKKEKMDHQHPLFMKNSMKRDINKWRGLRLAEGEDVSVSEAIRRMIDRCLVADGIKKPSDDTSN